MRLLVTLIVRCLPPPVRRGREDEILATLRRTVTGARRRGRLAVLSTWMAEIADLLRAAATARMSPDPTRPFRQEFTMLELVNLRHARRSLASRPGFVMVAVLTLGLAIGATTAILSVVDALVLRPLPYRDAERMVELWTMAERTGISSMAQAVRPTSRVRAPRQ